MLEKKSERMSKTNKPRNKHAKKLSVLNTYIPGQHICIK
jgi:hypothetical protein